MPNDQQLRHMNRLVQLVYRGHGVGLPDPRDLSKDAVLIRSVYAKCENTVRYTSGTCTAIWMAAESRSSEAEQLHEQIDASDLPWPYRSDLTAMLNAEEQVWSLMEPTAFELSRSEYGS